MKTNQERIASPVPGERRSSFAAINQTLSGAVKSAPKKVNFAETCRVVLIPKRHEYTAAGIRLWSTSQEFEQMKYEGRRERLLEKFVLQHVKSLVIETDAEASQGISLT